MATFQRRSETIGAKQFTGNNAEEIAVFLSVGKQFKTTAEDVCTVAPVGYWAVKTSLDSWWLSDEEIKDDYQLVSQGQDENIPDGYR